LAFDHPVIAQTDIESILQTILPEFDAFLVESHLNRGRHRLTIQVFVDTDAGIQISQCADISRRLGKAIEERNLVEQPYELQVSSPGIDRPLKFLRQYKKNIGRTYRVILRGEPDSRTIEGTLESVEGEVLGFRTENEEVVAVRHAEIIESKEVLPW